MRTPNYQNRAQWVPHACGTLLVLWISGCVDAPAPVVQSTEVAEIQAEANEPELIPVERLHQDAGAAASIRTKQANKAECARPGLELLLSFAGSLEDCDP